MGLNDILCSAFVRNCAGFRPAVIRYLMPCFGFVRECHCFHSPPAPCSCDRSVKLKWTSRREQTARGLLATLWPKVIDGCLIEWRKSGWVRGRIGGEALDMATVARISIIMIFQKRTAGIVFLIVSREAGTGARSNIAIVILQQNPSR